MEDIVDRRSLNFDHYSLRPKVTNLYILLLFMSGKSQRKVSEFWGGNMEVLEMLKKSFSGLYFQGYPKDQEDLWT